jgi:4-amino-4-deoxy-L-arabinose transferase-like glycosyltransferase
MTPVIDAAFGQIARERIKRSPLRFYVVLPLKRAVGLWFNTHSQYYPFEGELFPPEGEGHETSQQIFLPIFMALVWVYTLLAIGGAWFLWQARELAARRWVVLVFLTVILRIGFFAMRENPEPRYVVELFPFLIVLGGVAAVRVVESFKSPKHAN